MTKEEGERDLKNLISIAQKAKVQFIKIGYKIGVDRADFYIKFLEKQINGEEGKNFQKFVKFKTLKRNHIESVKATDTHLEENIMNNEDIRIFVSVIEDEPDSRIECRTVSSNSVQRKSFNMNIDKKKLVPASNSVINLSSSVRSSKFKNFKLKNIGPKRRILPKVKYTTTPMRFRYKKSDIITLKHAPSISNNGDDSDTE